MMISIVIPAYNAEETIINCVKSVFSQTFSDWELIIIDDGSKDNTVVLLNSFFQTLSENDLKRTKLIQQVNQGPSVARNTGIKASKGKYIAFLDSDDEWVRNKLDVQMEYMQKDDALYLCATASGIHRVSVKLVYKYISFEELLYKCYFTTTAVLVKAEVFEKYEFDENQKYSEDYKLWLLIAHDYKCIYINSILAKNQSDKNSFGDSGLSSNLWKMQKGEMSNYLYLYKLKKIGLFKLIITTSFSFFKYLRRVFLVKIRNRSLSTS
jgi:glycosyltransferase involved in cell wall biosynthesis